MFAGCYMDPVLASCKVDAASAPNLGKSCDWQCDRSCMSMKQTSKADVKSDSSGCSDIFIKARR